MPIKLIFAHFGKQLVETGWNDNLSISENSNMALSIRFEK